MVPDFSKSKIGRCVLLNNNTYTDKLDLTKSFFRHQLLMKDSTSSSRIQALITNGDHIARECNLIKILVYK